LERFFVVDPVKSGVCVFEIEVTDVAALEQPSVNWILKPGERLFRVVSGPQKLVGSRVFSFFCFAKEEEAKEAAKKEIRIDMQRAAEAAGQETDELLLAEKAQNIQTIWL
jgi:hypothetical protein